MSDVSWLPGSIFDNIDKFANSLGYQNAGIAIQLALQPLKIYHEIDLIYNFLK
jgi:hypothetical protein